MTDPSRKDLYSILGISPTASLQEIKSAFRKALKENHPDVANGSTTRFFDIRDAYVTLSKEKTREEYDRSIHGQNDLGLIQILPTIYPEEIPLGINRARISLHLKFTGATEKSTSSGQGIELVILIDTSTSMAGTKLDAVKSACQALRGGLHPADKLTIIGFNDFPNILFENQDPTIPGLGNKIQTVQAKGGTELSKALDMAGQRLAAHHRKDRPQYIFLFTDGKTYGDENACLQFAAQAAENTVVVHCFGIGPEWNETLLEEISGRTGGSTNFLSQKQLTAKEILRYLHSAITRKVPDLYLSLTPSPESQILSIYRLNPSPQQIPFYPKMVIGRFSGEHQASILVELELNLQGNFTSKSLLTVSSWISGMPSAHTIDIPVPASSSNSEEKIPDETIRDVTQKVVLIRMQQKARKLINKGSLVEGKKLLNRVAELSRQYGHVSLAQTIVLELNELDASKHFSDEGEKKIHFGTRALLLPDEKEQKS